ncbi:TPA: hypothetical protein ACXRWX_003069 [Klebsiella variicola subsp. variicola]
MNHTLSDSQLEEMIKSAVNSSGPLPPDEKFSQLISALRELQERRKAAMDSEPVAWTWHYREKWHVTNDEERARDLAWDGVKIEPLYRHAQPATVTERDPIAWLNDAYLARGVVDGEAGSEDAGPGYIPVYREAGPQPAPVAQCPYPCGWDALNKLAIQDAAFAALALVSGEPATESIRSAVISNNDRLLKVISFCRDVMPNAKPVVTQKECQKCKGTGIADSGGVQPWGEPISIECDCATSQSTAVMDIDELRLAFEAKERESDEGFNLHKYGIGYADDATQARWEQWLACRAAMLQAQSSDEDEPTDDERIMAIEGIHSCERCGDEGWVVGEMGITRCACVQAGNSPVIPDCWCRTCRPVVWNDMRFVVCPDCGNKRCPRANDHRNACTGSNEPGQEGSAYPADPQEVPDGK